MAMVMEMGDEWPVDDNLAMVVSVEEVVEARMER